MPKIALLILLFFLNSCSFNNPFLSEEVDTVTVVKYTPYMKHHRAYFARNNLKIIVGKQKYRFLYHSKKHELGVLLHRKNQWLLYNFTKPDTPTIVIRDKTHKRYKDVLKALRKKGYAPRSLKALGHVPKIALRRYKGVKTILIEVKDYRRLKKLYEKAIRTYQSREIRSIKTPLPKALIVDYYEKYRKRARTARQFAQLQIIADKLGFNAHIPKKKAGTKKRQITPSASDTEKVETTQPAIEETPAEEEVVEEKAPAEENIKAAPPKEVYTTPKKTTKGYAYYRYHASYNELRRYLAKPGTASSLSYKQYRSLQQHAKKLKEERLLSEGSLEELIAAYKVNKNPKYKQRILTLMKDKQLNKN